MILFLNVVKIWSLVFLGATDLMVLVHGFQGRTVRSKFSMRVLDYLGLLRKCPSH